MNTVKYSPSELLSVLDAWEKFVGINPRGDRVTSPKYYPGQIAEGVDVEKAKKEVDRRAGLRLQDMLETVEFSEKAGIFLKTIKIRTAVALLLKK